MSAFTLTLTPQWGGTAFGPFQGTAVQLGSDNGACQIVLGPELGVAPVHAVVWLGADGSFGLQPGAHGAGLYLFSDGSPLARPVTAPVQARAGDAFALGSPTGPRFLLGHHTGAVARPPAPSRGPGVLPGADAMQRELQRQVTSRLGAGPLAGVNRWVQRFRSGSLFTPRAILGLLAAAGAAIAAIVSQFMG